MVVIAVSATVLRQPNGVAFDIVLLAHVVAAFVGFGSIVVTGAAAGLVRGDLDRAAAGRAAADAARHYFRPGTNWVGRTAYAVPVFGLALVVMSGGAFTSADAWVQIGATLWVVAIVLAEGMLWPTERRVQILLSEAGGLSDAATSADAEHPAPTTELRRCCRRLMLLSGCLSLLFLVTVVLMVAQPGN